MTMDRNGQVSIQWKLLVPRGGLFDAPEVQAPMRAVVWRGYVLVRILAFFGLALILAAFKKADGGGWRWAIFPGCYWKIVSRCLDCACRYEGKKQYQFHDSTYPRLM